MNRGATGLLIGALSCFIFSLSPMAVSEAQETQDYEERRQETLESLSRINAILGRRSQKKNSPASEIPEDVFEKDASESKSVDEQEKQLPAALRSTLELGLMHYDLGNYDEAESQFRKIMIEAPEVPEIYYYLARILEKKLKVKEAISAYDEAIKRDRRMHKAVEARETLLGKYLDELLREIRVDSNYAEAHKEIGWVYLIQGNMSKANKFLDNAMKLDPSMAEVYQYKARIAQSRGKLSLAYRLLEKAFQLAPQDLSIFSDFKAVSRQVMESGEDVAVTVGNEREPGMAASGTASPQDSIRRYMEQTYVALQRENYQVARDCLQKILKIDPQNSEALFTLSAIDEAESGQETVLKYYEEGNQALEDEQWEEALSLFLKVLDSAQDFEHALDFSFKLALAYEKTGHIDDAIKVYQALIEQSERKEEALYRLGMLYYHSDDYFSARTYFGKLKASSSYFKLHPRELELYNKALFKMRFEGKKYFVFGAFAVLLLLIAGLLFFLKYPAWRKNYLFDSLKKAKDAGQWKRVLTLCDSLEAMKMNSTELFSAHLNKAKALFKTGDHTGVVSECKILLSMDPDNRYAHDLLGKAYLQLGTRTPEAAREFMMMLQYEFSNYKLHRALVDYYLEMEEKSPALFYKKEIYNDKVVDVFRRLLKREPDDRRIQAVLATIFLEKKKTDPEAIEVFEKVAVNNPDDYKLLRHLSKAYIEKAMYTRAESILKKLVEKDVDNVLVHKMFRDVFLKQGRYDELLDEYRRLCDKYPGNLRLKDILSRLKLDYTGEVKRRLEKTYEDARSSYIAGMAKLREEDYRGALELFKQSHGDARMRKSVSKKIIMCHLGIGNLSLALEEYERSNFVEEMMDEELKELCYRFGKLYEERGDFQKALFMYDKICRVDIGFRDVFDRFEELHGFVTGKTAPM